MHGRAQQQPEPRFLLVGQRRRIIHFTLELLQPRSALGWRPEYVPEFPFTAGDSQKLLIIVDTLGMMPAVSG
jgi:hypothetical protein